MKTLLACLNNEAHAKDTLRLALPIARAHESHLVGLHAQQALVFYPGASVHIPGEIYASFQEAREEDADAIRKIFEDATRAEDFPSEWRMVPSSSLDASERMVESAFAADMVIMGQAESEVGNAVEYHAQEHVIRHAGRPVLHVPLNYKGEHVGKKVVIGWSPTREAARAVHDALPLLAPGAEVSVVAVAHGASADFGGATDLARALDRHGFKTEVVARTASRGQVAEELEEIAFEADADLIVTGAFGHSRLYDFVIGAVTLDLMRNSRLPVLFSR